jgi:hypothetical protein
MLEVLGENYIRTARAYGLPERLIVYKVRAEERLHPDHAVLGLGIGRLLGGAVLVEIVFARPGPRAARLRSRSRRATSPSCRAPCWWSCAVRRHEPSGRPLLFVDRSRGIRRTDERPGAPA